MDRFSNIGGQVGELAICALISKQEALVNLTCQLNRSQLRNSN